MRSFYNPDLTAEEADALDWANYLTVQTVQAFLGSVSDNFLAIAVEPRPGEGTVYVALAQPSEDDEEEVADAVAELDALLEGRVALSHSITYGRPDVRRWVQDSVRLVFLRRA